MTVELCAQFCSGYTFMGVEYGSECYCGNSVANGSSQVTTESGLSCTDARYACLGNSSEFCGGYQAYDFYAKAGATTTAATPSHTGYVYVMDSFVVPTANTSAGSYNYIGCYNDPGASTRALNGNNTAFTARSIEECASFCTGFNYFGSENGGEWFVNCFANTRIHTKGSIVTAATA
ncbi:hypothetical protein LTR66_008958 [Elasticomyces elasticus]|nr:hypothetical protein LTR66_008958 [Elasticomyces elasticus]